MQKILVLAMVETVELTHRASMFFAASLCIVLAVGVSKVVAMAFFKAAFFLAPFWTVRTAPKR